MSLAKTTFEGCNEEASLQIEIVPLRRSRLVSEIIQNFSCAPKTRAEASLKVRHFGVYSILSGTAIVGQKRAFFQEVI